MRRFLSFSLLLVASLTLSACDVMDFWLRDSVDQEEGVISLQGLSAPVSIRRDDYGVPRVEAANEGDLAFGVGYAMASDRLAQMVSFSLVAQGRLSEMAGPVSRDFDVYMRTLGLRRQAERYMGQVSPALQASLQRFADGVNTWVAAHRESLPLEFRLSGYQPEPWTPLNSMDIFMVLNLGLSLNAHEEIAFLDLASKLGPEKAAWLIPSYADEPIALDEASKLGDFPFKELQAGMAALAPVNRQLAEWFVPLRQAASNNWAVAGSRTVQGASILANDTHLLLEHPPLWMMMQVATPDFQAGGIAIAGLPGVVAGYNGHLAWGMTMVMADSQDIFIEKLRQENGKTFYEHNGEWKPVIEREEIIRIKGKPDEKIVVQETRHGPLLNSALQGKRVNEVMPPNLPLSPRYGLALQTTAAVADNSIASFFHLAQAKDMAAARRYMADIGAIHLNMVFANRNNIAWQVIGSYPLRKKGRGYFPSPGWTDDYDWQGREQFEHLPYQLNPPEGFVATANHRTVLQGQGAYLSGSWYAPERYERIHERLAMQGQQTAATTVALQQDTVDLAALKLVALLKQHEKTLRERMAKQPEVVRESAEKTWQMLLGFNGDMKEDSAEAAMYAIFLDSLTRKTFADELGGGREWQSFLQANAITYSAQQDHMLGREDSPFWDDIHTPVKENKWDIFVSTLAISWQQALFSLGADSTAWRWGKIHTYTWESGATKMKPWLSPVESGFVGLLGRYLDRGPFPAPGSSNTVNVSGYTIGDGYKTWNIPAMRLVVDFSQPEPMQLLIAGGQSGNPASRHYDDGIPLFLSDKNRLMAFHDAEAIKKQFHKVLVLQPAAATPSTP